MSDSSRSMPAWLKWLLRVAGAGLVLGPVVFLILRGKPLWPVWQAFFKAGMRFNKDVTAAQFGVAAGTVAGALVAVALGCWLLRRSWKKNAARPATPVATPAAPVAQSAARQSRPQRKVQYSSCVVYHTGADARRAWQFDAGNGEFPLHREEVAAADQNLPAAMFTKTWRSLWQRKLNVAWLPPESVFLRVAHLPRSSFEETVSMVELQLERYSPIPVTQAVWSVHVLSDTAAPKADEASAAHGLQTVIILFAEREAVEGFLGQLEGQGYLADRLEIPAIDQLQATAATEDGAWIYPEAVGGRNTALVAWWCGGVLQNLNLVSFPASGDRATGVKEQLAQIAWAGELEGWLTGPPAWHLVADDALAAEWEPALRQGLDEPVQVSAPLRPAQLAGLTARRATAASPASNLLPPEFAKRYQLRFQDRLWMRGLAAVVALYVLGVLIYALALGIFVLRTQAVEKKVAANSNSYTNAIQLKARYQVLKDRQDLKFAALDCWRAVAEVMPEAVTLESLNFSDGHRLTLNGSAPSGEGKGVVDFFDQVRKARTGDQSLFDTAKGDSSPRLGTGPGGTITWSFGLELKRVEAQ